MSLPAMRAALLTFVERHRGVVTRAEALRNFAAHVVDDALADGALIRLAPMVYALPSTGECRNRLMAGLLLWRPDGAISHTDGLGVWELPTALDERVHLTVPGGRPATTWPAATLHRRRGFEAAPPHVVIRGGLRVVRLEQAIVESWALLPEVDRRVPAIVALRERRTTGARLLECLEANDRPKGAAEMRQVFALVAEGLHSPLELWGHEQVFSDRRLPIARCQVPVDIPSGRVYLDRLYDAEMVNVELDGAAYHGAPGQRERDLRRDAALAALGFVTVRLSHLRLHADPEGVRAQLLEVLATRRRQLGLAVA
jgi:very-short-patch-repair endonuclease